MSAYTEIPKIIAETGTLPPKVLGDLNSRYPGASSQSVEYFVAPPPLGDDNNDGSEDYPLATISSAVDKLPDVIRAGHEYTITLLPGEWDEPLTLEHLTVQGQLTIRGSSGDRDRHKLHRVRTDTILGHLRIEALTTTVNTAFGPSFWVRRSTYVEVDNCAVESNPDIEKTPSGVIGLLADYGSNVWVRDSDFGGKRYGIRANYLSRVHSHNNTGTNNTFGLGARWGGIMTTYGTQPQGDTDKTNSSGGLMTQGHGTKLGFPDDEPRYLMGQWGNRPDGSAFKKYWGIRSNNTGINSPIQAGQRLRITLERINNGPVMIDVTWVGSTSSTNARHQHKRFAGYIGNELFSHTGNIISSTVRSDDRENYITLEPQGSGVYYIYITPGDEIRSGEWGVDLEYSLMRGISSANLTDVRIV